MSAEFWSRVDTSGDCWEWLGSKEAAGYGKWRGWRVHRYSYTEFVGPIPDGLVIDHLCRNKGCVNPDHLEPVTIRENTIRGVTANRETCRSGKHPWPESARSYGDGWQRCIECRREARAGWKRKTRPCPICGNDVRVETFAAHGRRYHRTDIEKVSA